MNQQTDKVTVPGQVKVDITPTGVKHAFFVKENKTTTYIMRNGNKVLFSVGAVPAIPHPAFVTDIEGYINELMESVKTGHEQIHLIEGYETVTDVQLDPLGAVKAAAEKEGVAKFLASKDFQDYLKNVKGVGTPADSETTVKPGFTGANSSSVAEAAGASDSTAGTSAPVPGAGTPTGAVTPATGAINLAALKAK